ncbi:uncharacterized protein [Salminus brasiliensis]|uniref:uncharacterized protein n=1 Tax=Salminus brasiliensis TaxID=930266 RepID=UPI003B836A53
MRLTVGEATAVCMISHSPEAWLLTGLLGGALGLPQGRARERESLCVRLKESSRATLPCGKLTNGKVTWSRDINGERVDILTTHNGELTKHITDPDKRYRSGADIVLIILRVSQSDAGRYDCNGTTVELTLNETCQTSATTLTTTGTSTKPTAALTSTPVKDPPGGNNLVLWAALITAGICVGAVLLVMIWRCFKMKAALSVEQTQGHVYISIDDARAARQPALSVEQTQGHVYISIDDARAARQPACDHQKTNEPIYYLATHSGVHITGKNERSNPEQLYAKVQKPKK